MLNIAIRADSSDQIGIGHIMRCLTLAIALEKEHKAKISFFCRNNQGNINKLIENSGFSLVEMQPAKETIKTPLAHSAWLGASQQDDAHEFLTLAGKQVFNLVIIDHYAIDQQWQKLIENKTQKIMIIDDLADRKHRCDYLLDQTYNCSEDKYKQFISPNCVQMLGTKYALLREEFQYSKMKEKPIKEAKLLVMFGGTDPDNLTLQTLIQLKKRSDIEQVTIILSDAAQHKASISQFISQQNNHTQFNLKISPSNICTLMLQHKLAIGAAGATSWERCTVGLPTVVVIQADNQRQIAKELYNKGIITYIEPSLIATQLNDEIDQWLNDPILLQKSINNGQLICDGQGTSRVINTLFNDE